LPLCQKHSGIYFAVLFMKKVLSLFLIIFIFTAFFGCTSKNGNSAPEASSSERDIVFTYSCVKCTDSVMYETSDDITVVSSVDDINKYKTKLASTVDTEKGVQGDGTATVSQKLSVYNAGFFENKKLIIVRKNFDADAEMIINGFSVGKTDGIINAELRSGGNAEKSLRLFLVQVNASDISDKLKVSLNVTDGGSKSESTSAVSLVIGKGNTEYKNVSNNDDSAKIKNIVESCSYSAASYDKTDYTSGGTDITVTYDGHSYLFSDTFICIDGKYYNPDLSVKQQLSTIYDSLTETAVSSQDGDILIESED